MFQSYSNDLSLQNKRTEIVASFNLGQNFALEIATKYTGLFCLPLQRKTPIVTNYLFASSILRNTQLTIQSFDEYFFSCETLFRKPRILHLHISHNAPYFPPPPPPQKLPNRVCLFFLHFSWVSQPSQEKLKTMLMQNFGGQIRCIMGDVHVA